MHKDIEKILYSEQDIKNIVKRLAKEIEKDYNGKDFIMVGLLKGCVSFMVDLMREVNLDFSIDFLAVSSYGNSTVSSGRVNIRKIFQLLLTASIFSLLRILWTRAEHLLLLHSIFMQKMLRL